MDRTGVGTETLSKIPRPVIILIKAWTTKYKCKCDAAENQLQIDEGYVYNSFAGITQMTFVQKKDAEGWGRISLGPMECRGISKGPKFLDIFLI